MKVIVSSARTSAVPEFGGSAWVRLNYVLGLRAMGIDAYWVDRIGAQDPFKERRTLDYLMKRFREMASEFGIADRYCVVYDEGEQYFGLSRAELESLVGQADLLINFNGYLPEGDVLAGVSRRVCLDVDPGFTHIWALQGELHLDRHQFFFTVGLNVGGDGFEIPGQGVEWRPIHTPVALDHWPALIDERCECFSTVAEWWGSQDAVYEGVRYGNKREQLLQLIDLPEQTTQEIELALLTGQWDFKDVGDLSEKGWTLVNPYRVAGNAHSFAEFVRYSRAEFSVAKSGYVKSKCGWFSDRTADYLASGKPCLVESTGIEPHFPTGEGLLTFTNADEARDGIEEINRNYLRHCRAARELAETYLDSEKVLGGMLAQVGL